MISFISQSSGSPRPIIMSGHNDVFGTEQIRPPNESSSRNSIGIITPYVPTQFPIGLTKLALSRGKNIRVKAYIDNVQYTESNKHYSATVHLDPWGDTVLYAASCTWIPLMSPDRDFQSGKITLKGDRLAYSVNFDRTYATPPKIVVWISGLDMSKEAGWRVRTEATGITTTGFTLKSWTWHNTQLYHVEATWVAYPESRSNIESGGFTTSEVRSPGDPQHEHSKAVTFSKRFERTPRVYFALSMIDSNNTGDLNLVAYVTDLTSQGMNVHLDSWGEPNMWTTEGRWLAIQDL